MYLENINIKNFRNIENEILFPSKNINIILGKNAQGKTNFLETVYVTANLKSFRGKKLSEVINKNKNKCTVEIKINKNKVENELIIEIENNKKNVLLNKKKTDRILETLGYLDTVLFYPDDIIIVKGSPLLRRNLIDRAIFQSDNNYLNLFQQYLHCLKQRNAALKENNSVADLWDGQFSVLATRVIFYRVSYINRINYIFEKIFKKIYRCDEKVEIKYPFSEYNKTELKNIFYKNLLKNREKERLYGITLIGPHRDDPVFLLNGQPLSLYGSQGQQRSFMLAFKTAQIIDYKECRGIHPVLLLDDMTSELDQDRKEYFFDFLLNQAGQVFITSTDFKLQKNRQFLDAKVFKVENGKIGEYN